MVMIYNKFDDLKYGSIETAEYAEFVAVSIWNRNNSTLSSYQYQMDNEVYPNF